MPALPNPRHERFAKALARGAGSREAYRGAGYSPGSDANADRAAWKLKANPLVKARLAELAAREAVKAGFNTDDLSLALMALAKAAQDAGTAGALGTARAAIMDVARLNGLLPGKDAGGGGPAAEDWLDAMAE